MESGFKKLLSLKFKSRNGHNKAGSDRLSGDNPGLQDTASVAIANGQAGYPHQSQQSVDEQRSIESKRLSTKPNTSADGGGRPSSGRIQPVLVGISRPSTATSRPSTAGSFQNAIRRAADAVAFNPSSRSPSLLQSPTSPSGKIRSPRHVDIFSKNVGPYKSHRTYNEEIADRNLDARRLGEEEPFYRYVPSSRYQEEVAVRNAQPITSPKQSFESSWSTREDAPNSNSPLPLAATQFTPNKIYSYEHLSSKDPNAPKAKVMDDSVAYHSRQYFSRTRDPPVQLPVIPQEHAEEHGNDDSIYAERKRKRNSLQLRETPSRPRVHQRWASHDGIASEKQSEEVNLDFKSAGAVKNTQNPNGAGFIQTSPKAKSPGHSTTMNTNMVTYSLSPSESSSEQFRAHGSRNVFSDRGLHKLQSPDTSIRPNSARSKSSSGPKGNGANFDGLDNDSDAMSDASPRFELAESPVLGQAKSDQIRRMQASVISSGASRAPKQPRDGTLTEIQPNGLSLWNHVNNNSNDTGDEEIRRFPSLVKQSRIGTSSAITFSPINTLVSLPPKHFEEHPKTATSAVQATKPALRSEMGTNAIISEKNAPVETVKNDSVLNSERPGSSRGPGGQKSLPSIVEEPKLTFNTAPDANSKIVHSDSQEATIASSPTIKPPNEQIRNNYPSIPTSAQILNSPPNSVRAELASPNQAYGVHARDFAISPTMPAPVIKLGPKTKIRDQNHNEGQQANLHLSNMHSKVHDDEKKVTPRPRQKIITPTLYKSTFNESEFAHKQQEARAALLRLQESLDEEFLIKQKSNTSRPKSGSRSLSHDTGYARSHASQVRNRPDLAHTRSEADGAYAYARSGPSSREPTQRPIITVSPASGKSPPNGKGKAKSPPSNNIEKMAAMITEMRLSPQPFTNYESPVIPPSPGEVSLSSFPLPSSVSPGSRFSTEIRPRSNMARRNSTKSQASSTSAFSIPYHIIPDRSSSKRDSLLHEDDDDFA